MVQPADDPPIQPQVAQRPMSPPREAGTLHVTEPGSVILIVTGMIGLVARRHLRQRIMEGE